MAAHAGMREQEKHCEREPEEGTPGGSRGTGNAARPARADHHLTPVRRLGQAQAARVFPANEIEGVTTYVRDLIGRIKADEENKHLLPLE
ncbi:hypothetical protein [Nonomuraea wenchangensis]|uniref:hypothetical protein n=1 Tax=Nonomuraea wenchangensis TaxID=568860 RepID=UPI00331EE89E